MYIYIYIYIYICNDFLSCCLCFPLGVVVRSRSVSAAHIALRPYGQLLLFFCSWDRKSLERTLSSYFG